MSNQTNPAKRYHYNVKYYIADAFGNLRWEGVCMISQNVPRPTDEEEMAVLDMHTAKTIRTTCDKTPGCPPGRVLIAAWLPAA